MLTGTGSVQHVVLIGSTSDLGLSIIDSLPVTHDAKLTLIGRTYPMNNRVIEKYTSVNFIENDMCESIDRSFWSEKLSNLADIDVVVFASAVLLKDNLSAQVADIENMLKVNITSSTYLLEIFSRKMKEQAHGVIIYISSFAVSKPRLVNYQYGATKAFLDYYCIGKSDELDGSGVKMVIIRPGFVYTKMTGDLSSSPFALKLNEFSKITNREFKNIEKLKNLNILYFPKILKYVAIIFKILPRKILNKLG